MKNINEIYILIQARLGSERVSSKILKPFVDIKFVHILFNKLKKLKITDKKNNNLLAYKDDLKKLGKEYIVNIFNRSKKIFRYKPRYSLEMGIR